MIGRLIRALRPCDTSAAFEALDRADQASRSAALQSRALSRAIKCGDPISFVERLLKDGRTRVRIALRSLHPEMLDEPLPADMQDSLGKLDRIPF